MLADVNGKIGDAGFSLWEIGSSGFLLLDGVKDVLNRGRPLFCWI
jgi:hypothetical protein